MRRATSRALILATVAALSIAASAQETSAPQPAVPNEWMFPVSSQVAWTAVKQVLADLKTGTERVDDAGQFAVSRWITDRPRRRPDTLPLPSGWRFEEAQFHLYVAPGIEPARVAIGSMIHARPASSSGNGRLTIYNVDTLNAWLLDRLVERLAMRPQPMPVSPQGRADLSRQMMPAGLTDPCSGRAAVSGAFPVRGAPFQPPKMLHKVTPVFPRAELRDRKEGAIRLIVLVSEHGTILSISDPMPAAEPDGFKAAAQAALALWKYEPARVGPCAATMPVTVSTSFSVQ